MTQSNFEPVSFIIYIIILVMYVSVSNPQFLSRLGLAGSREYKINEDILKYFGRILGGFGRILGGTPTVFVPRT